MLAEGHAKVAGIVPPKDVASLISEEHASPDRQNAADRGQATPVGARAKRKAPADRKRSAWEAELLGQAVADKATSAQGRKEPGERLRTLEAEVEKRRAELDGREAVLAQVAASLQRREAALKDSARVLDEQRRMAEQCAGDRANLELERQRHAHQVARDRADLEAARAQHEVQTERGRAELQAERRCHDEFIAESRAELERACAATLAAQRAVGAGPDGGPDYNKRLAKLERSEATLKDAAKKLEELDEARAETAEMHRAAAQRRDEDGRQIARERADANGQIAARQAQLAQERKALEGRAAQLSETERRLHASETEMERRKAELDKLKAELDQRAAALQALEGEAGGRDKGRTEEHARLLQERSGRVWRASLEERESQLALQQKDIGDAEMKLREFEAVANQRREDLNQVLANLVRKEALLNEREAGQTKKEALLNERETSQTKQASRLDERESRLKDRETAAAPPPPQYRHRGAATPQDSGRHHRHGGGGGAKQSEKSASPPPRPGQREDSSCISSSSASPPRASGKPPAASSRPAYVKPGRRQAGCTNRTGAGARITSPRAIDSAVPEHRNLCGTPC